MTGRKIQETKIMHYYWKWIYENMSKKIVVLEANLEVHEKVIVQEDIFKSTRTLGVHITPLLQWDRQFEVMRKSCICQ